MKDNSGKIKKPPLVEVAPMMDWTDRHCRFFHRLLAPHAVLYTEMVTTGALIHGDRDRFLRFSPQEHPVVLQLGGSDPADLALCAKMAEDYGYDEINLNCGCPSDRVQKGRFGACLMTEPKLVADCVSAMAQAVRIPVTIKCRIGIDDCDEEECLENFLSVLAQADTKKFIIHARKAWLKGLSPRENREIPPLRYDIAARARLRYPHIPFILNGGLNTLPLIEAHINDFDGVMIGREAYQNPWFLAELSAHLYATPLPNRADVVRAMIPYIAEQKAQFGTPVHSATRHMLGLFNGLPGARKWRQIVGNGAISSNDPHILEEGLRAMTKSLDLPLI